MPGRLFNSPSGNSIPSTFDLPEIAVKSKKPDYLKYSQTDIAALAELIYGEARGEPEEGQIAVGVSVIKRAKQKRWTVARMCTKGYDGYPFPVPAEDQAKFLALAKKCYKSLSSVPDGVFYFANEKISTDSRWISYIRKYTWKTIGEHTFYYHPKFFPRA